MKPEKFLILVLFILGAVKCNDLLASDSPMLMKILEAVDVATSDDHLFDVTLQLLRSLCVCMTETLKAKEEKLQHDVDSNSLQADEYSNNEKILQLYRKIYNNTCINLCNEIADKLNEKQKGHDDERFANKNHTSQDNNYFIVSQTTEGTSNINMNFEKMLFETLVETKYLHTYTMKQRNILPKPTNMKNNITRQSLITIITLSPKTLKGNLEKLDYETVKKIVASNNSHVEIDIMNTKFYDSNLGRQSRTLNVTTCNLESLYIFFVKKKLHDQVNVLKLLNHMNGLKIYIDVTVNQSSDDFLNICCNNHSQLCEKILMKRDFDNKIHIKDKQKAIKNYKTTIMKLKRLVQLYDAIIKGHEKYATTTTDTDCIRSTEETQNKTPSDLQDFIMPTSEKERPSFIRLNKEMKIIDKPAATVKSKTGNSYMIILNELEKSVIKKLPSDDFALDIQHRDLISESQMKDTKSNTLSVYDSLEDNNQLKSEIERLAQKKSILKNMISFSFPKKSRTPSTLRPIEVPTTQQEISLLKTRRSEMLRLKTASSTLIPVRSNKVSANTTEKEFMPTFLEHNAVESAVKQKHEMGYNLFETKTSTHTTSNLSSAPKYSVSTSIAKVVIENTISDAIKHAQIGNTSKLPMTSLQISTILSPIITYPSIDDKTIRTPVYFNHTTTSSIKIVKSKILPNSRNISMSIRQDSIRNLNLTSSSIPMKSKNLTTILMHNTFYKVSPYNVTERSLNSITTQNFENNGFLENNDIKMFSRTLANFNVTSTSSSRTTSRIRKDPRNVPSIVSSDLTEKSLIAKRQSDTFTTETLSSISDSFSQKPIIKTKDIQTTENSRRTNIYHGFKKSTQSSIETVQSAASMQIDSLYTTEVLSSVLSHDLKKHLNAMLTSNKNQERIGRQNINENFSTKFTNLQTKENVSNAIANSTPETKSSHTTLNLQITPPTKPRRKKHSYKLKQSTTTVTYSFKNSQLNKLNVIKSPKETRATKSLPRYKINSRSTASLPERFENISQKKNSRTFTRSTNTKAMIRADNINENFPLTTPSTFKFLNSTKRYTNINVNSSMERYNQRTITLKEPFKRKINKFTTKHSSNTSDTNEVVGNAGNRPIVNELNTLRRVNITDKSQILSTIHYEASDLSKVTGYASILKMSDDNFARPATIILERIPTDKLVTTISNSLDIINPHKDSYNALNDLSNKPDDIRTNIPNMRGSSSIKNTLLKTTKASTRVYLSNVDMKKVAKLNNSGIFTDTYNTLSTLQIKTAKDYSRNRSAIKDIKHVNDTSSLYAENYLIVSKSSMIDPQYENNSILIPTIDNVPRVTKSLTSDNDLQFQKTTHVDAVSTTPIMEDKTLRCKNANQISDKEMLKKSNILLTTSKVPIATIAKTTVKGSDNPQIFILSSKNRNSLNSTVDKIQELVDSANKYLFMHKYNNTKSLTTAAEIEKNKRSLLNINKENIISTSLKMAAVTENTPAKASIAHIEFTTNTTANPQLQDFVITSTIPETIPSTVNITMTKNQSKITIYSENNQTVETTTTTNVLQSTQSSHAEILPIFSTTFFDGMSQSNLITEKQLVEIMKVNKKEKRKSLYESDVLLTTNTKLSINPFLKTPKDVITQRSTNFTAKRYKYKLKLSTAAVPGKNTIFVENQYNMTTVTNSFFPITIKTMNIKGNILKTTENPTEDLSILMKPTLLNENLQVHMIAKNKSQVNNLTSKNTNLPMSTSIMQYITMDRDSKTLQGLTEVYQSKKPACLTMANIKKSVSVLRSHTENPNKITYKHMKNQKSTTESTLKQQYPVLSFVLNEDVNTETSTHAPTMASYTNNILNTIINIATNKIPTTPSITRKIPNTKTRTIHLLRDSIPSTRKPLLTAGRHTTNSNTFSKVSILTRGGIIKRYPSTTRISISTTKKLQSTVSSSTTRTTAKKVVNTTRPINKLDMPTRFKVSIVEKILSTTRAYNTEEALNTTNLSCTDKILKTSKNSIKIKVSDITTSSNIDKSTSTERDQRWITNKLPNSTKINMIDGTLRHKKIEPITKMVRNTKSKVIEKVPSTIEFSIIENLPRTTRVSVIEKILSKMRTSINEKPNIIGCTTEMSTNSKASFTEMISGTKRSRVLEEIPVINESVGTDKVTSITKIRTKKQPILFLAKTEKVPNLFKYSVKKKVASTTKVDEIKKISSPLITTSVKEKVINTIRNSLTKEPNNFSLIATEKVPNTFRDRLIKKMPSLARSALTMKIPSTTRPSKTEKVKSTAYNNITGKVLNITIKRITEKISMTNKNVTEKSSSTARPTNNTEKLFNSKNTIIKKLPIVSTNVTEKVPRTTKITNVLNKVLKTTTNNIVEKVPYLTRATIMETDKSTLNTSEKREEPITTLKTRNHISMAINSTENTRIEGNITGSSHHHKVLITAHNIGDEPVLNTAGITVNVSKSTISSLFDPLSHMILIVENVTEVDQNSKENKYSYVALLNDTTIDKLDIFTNHVLDAVHNFTVGTINRSRTNITVIDAHTLMDSKENEVDKITHNPLFGKEMLHNDTNTITNSNPTVENTMLSVQGNVTKEVTLSKTSNIDLRARLNKDVDFIAKVENNLEKKVGHFSTETNKIDMQTLPSHEMIFALKNIKTKDKILLHYNSLTQNNSKIMGKYANVNNKTINNTKRAHKNNKKPKNNKKKIRKSHQKYKNKMRQRPLEAYTTQKTYVRPIDKHLDPVLQPHSMYEKENFMLNASKKQTKQLVHMRHTTMSLNSKSSIKTDLRGMVKYDNLLKRLNTLAPYKERTVKYNTYQPHYYHDFDTSMNNNDWVLGRETFKSQSYNYLYHYRSIKHTTPFYYQHLSFTPPPHYTHKTTIRSSTASITPTTAIMTSTTDKTEKDEISNQNEFQNAEYNNMMSKLVSNNYATLHNPNGHPLLEDEYDKTRMYPVNVMPPKRQRKVMKRIKSHLKTHSEFAPQPFFLSEQESMAAPKTHWTPKRINYLPPPPAPKKILFNPRFDSFESEKKPRSYFRAKPLIIENPKDEDFYRATMTERGDVLTMKERARFLEETLHLPADRLESVVEKPASYYEASTKPKFLRDRVDSIRNFIAVYPKFTTRMYSWENYHSQSKEDSDELRLPEPSVFFYRGRNMLDTTTVTDWWLDDMYLKVRLPLPINSNPGMVFPLRHFAKMEEVADLGALFIDDLLDYKEMLDRGELPLERATSREKGQPLCMEQFYRLLGVCRIPEVGRDRLELPPIRGNADEGEELVVAACRNYFYPIPVKAVDRGRLTPGEIQAQLLHCMVDAAGAPPAPRVGLLTAMGRDQWARARETLIRDEGNRTNLELISRSLCLVCLDEGGGDRADCDPDTNAMLRAMHGAGTRHHSANRWFDKTVQLIISQDGTVGMCYEHSAEGVAVVRLAERALARAEVAERPAPPPALLPAPPPMTWNIPPEVHRTIEQAARDLDRAIADLDHKVYTYRGYGREFMKSCKTSPDVYIQLALQYAYYKMYGYLVTTYESASLRRFRNGRVDNIRSAHAAAHAWAAAMCTAETPPLNTADDGQKKDQKKLELFEEAARKQTEIMEANILGRGIDNHLLGLREMARETFGELPPLFTDATYKQMIEFKLSTSQVATTTEGTFMGYGAVVPDGYGCSYNPKRDCVIFCISSFVSSSVTSTEAFRQSLEEALNSMQLMFQARQADT